MKKMMGLQAVGMAAALAAPAASAQDVDVPRVEAVRIGMLDTAVRNLPNKVSNVKVISRDFVTGSAAEWTGESDNSHGELVAASAVKAARSLAPRTPIEIYVSNIYTRSDADNARLGGGRVGRGLADPGKIHLRLDYQAASKAVDWMKEQGVTVMILTATGSDSPGMRALADQIRKSGMTLIASTNNDPARGKVFPAAYPGVIAVAGSNKSLPISTSPELASYVSYVTDGRSPIRNSNVEIGSSFAAGVVGGFAAAYKSARPTEGEAEFRRWLDAKSSSVTYAGVSIPTVPTDLPGGIEAIAITKSDPLPMRRQPSAAALGAMASLAAIQR